MQLPQWFASLLRSKHDLSHFVRPPAHEVAVVEHAPPVQSFAPPPEQTTVDPHAVPQKFWSPEMSTQPPPQLTIPGRHSQLPLRQN